MTSSSFHFRSLLAAIEDGLEEGTNEQRWGNQGGSQCHSKDAAGRWLSLGWNMEMDRNGHVQSKAGGRKKEGTQ